MRKGCRVLKRLGIHLSIASAFYSYAALLLASMPLENPPCQDFLDMIDRPTVGESVCVVKPHHFIMEMGYQFFTVYSTPGQGINFPEVELRLGLPFATELIVLAPNFIHANIIDTPTLAGVSSTSVGFKHQFGTYHRWITAVSGFITVPGASKLFGNDGFGYFIDGLFNYSFSDFTSLTFRLEISSEVTAEVFSSLRYYSFNPEAVLAWQNATKNLQLYIEAYGATQISPGLGHGFNADVGIQYLITPHIEIDASYGWRMQGVLGNVGYYVGLGGAFLI